MKYGIWDLDRKDWVRESSKYYGNNRGGILAFEEQEKAMIRAAEYFGYPIYFDCNSDGWCEIRELK